MAAPSNKFRKVKKDLSPYLFHFTSGDECQSILKTILNEQRLKANKNYICFTASPITQVGDFFETLVNRTGLPMYQPYGIGFSRDILIREYGAKNVIYGDNNDKKILKDCGLSWRFMELDVDSYDFEWLREWRIPGKEFDFSNFPKEHMIVITPTDKELLNYVTKDYYIQVCEYDSIAGEKYDDLIEKYERFWKGISLEHIRKMNLLDDYQVSGSTSTQLIGDDMCLEVEKQISEQIKELNDIIAKYWEDTFGEILDDIR